MPTDVSNRPRSAYRYEYAKKLVNPGIGQITVYKDGLENFGLENHSRTYVQSRRRGEGWINPKPYSRGIDQGWNTGIPGFASGASGGFSCVCSGVVPGTVRGTVPSFDGGLANAASIEARNQVRQSKVNFAVAFAEGRRTADMVSNSAKRIASVISNVRKGNFVTAAKTLGISTPKSLRRVEGKRPGQEWYNAYLEYQYGWKPLLSDVRGAAELMARKDLENPDRYMCTVKARKVSPFKVRYRNRVCVTGSGIPYYQDSNLDGSHSVFVRYDYVLRDARMAELAQTGFINPLTVAWELMPFSFVADWFVPIGNYVSLLDAETGWSFLIGTSTTRTDAKETTWIRPRPIAGWFSVVAGGTSVRRQKSINRSVVNSPPMPRLEARNPMRGSNVMSAISLIAQAMK